MSEDFIYGQFSNDDLIHLRDSLYLAIRLDQRAAENGTKPSYHVAYMNAGRLSTAERIEEILEKRMPWYQEQLAELLDQLKIIYS